jgi:hypothetical protein
MFIRKLRFLQGCFKLNSCPRILIQAAADPQCVKSASRQRKFFLFHKLACFDGIQVIDI